MAQFEQPMKGWVGIRKTSGGGGMTATTDVRYLLASEATPLNPVNKTFLPCMNVSQYLGVFVQDGKTGAITLSGYVDPHAAAGQGLMDFNFLNGLVHGTTLDYNDLFAIGVNNGTATRIFGGCRLNSLSMSQMAAGGPVNIQMSFLSYDPDSGTESSFSAPSIKYGQILDRSKVTTSGLSDATMWAIQITRQAEHDFSFDTTGTPALLIYPDDIRSQNFAGMLTVIQRDKATTQITDTGTYVITLAPALTQANGKTVMTCQVQQQNLVKSIRVGNANYINNEFQLVYAGAGTSPLVIT